MCFSVSIVRFGWAGGPQRQFGSFRGWVCRLISFLQMENSLRSDSSICRNNAAAPIPKLLDLCCMSSRPSKSDSRSCWKQIFHIYFSLLPGYHIDQLREVWGKPDTSENSTACWKLGNDTTLVVSYKNNGIVAICGLKDDSGASIGE